MKLNKLTIMLGAAVMANAAFANQTCEAPYRSALPAYTYKLDKVLEVNGRQGITTDGKYLYVSGSKTLAKYDMDGKLIKENKDPLSAIKKKLITLATLISTTMNFMFPPNGLMPA